jgi:hypothetical protein
MEDAQAGAEVAIGKMLFAMTLISRKHGFLFNIRTTIKIGKKT